MSTDHCVADQHRRAKALASDLKAHRSVFGADVLAPRTGHRSTWTVEATLSTSTIAPQVLSTLTDHGSELADVSGRGPGHTQIVAKL